MSRQKLKLNASPQHLGMAPRGIGKDTFGTYRTNKAQPSMKKPRRVRYLNG